MCAYTQPGSLQWFALTSNTTSRRHSGGNMRLRSGAVSSGRNAISLAWVDAVCADAGECLQHGVGLINNIYEIETNCA